MATSSSGDIRAIEATAEEGANRRESRNSDAVEVANDGNASVGDVRLGEDNKTKGVRPFVCFESPNDSVVFLGRYIKPDHRCCCTLRNALSLPYRRITHY